MCMLHMYIIELQISWGFQDNFQKIFFYIENIFCDPTLEPSHRDGFNEGSQYMFVEKFGKIVPIFLFLPGPLYYRFSLGNKEFESVVI